MNPNVLRIRWLIRLRWTAIAGQAAMILACLGGLKLPIPFTWLFLVLGLAVTSQWVLWHLGRRVHHNYSTLVGGVLALDVVLLTAMLFLTGGPHNPFTVLYLTQIAIAASMLGVRWTWSLLALVLICFAGLFWRSVPLPLPPGNEAICGVPPANVHLVGMFVALACTGGCLAWFVARLNAQLWERKQLERKVAKVAQREEHDVGSMLHEDLCQRLSGLAALGRTLEHRLRGDQTIEADVAGEITRELKQALVLAHQMADRLQPVTALQDGFIAAVNELASTTQQKADIRCHVLDSEFPTELDHYTANHLYRMIQEAIDNVIRHARASMIQVQLSATTQGVSVTITDDRHPGGIAAPSRRRSADHALSQRPDRRHFEHRAKFAARHAGRRAIAPAGMIKLLEAADPRPACAPVFVPRSPTRNFSTSRLRSVVVWTRYWRSEHFRGNLSSRKTKRN